MQVLEYANDNDKSISTWNDDSGSYIRGFLISTKQNKNNWRITKNSGYLTQNFVGKDFAVIPNRIGNSVLLDGHVVGSKEEVIKAYSDNSYGKITKVLGPFRYNDSTDDFYYEHVTKLHNNKVASALMKHGSGTLVQFATSPHIFGLEGGDLDGWEKWEPAGIVLVNNPAYGKQSVITKMCNGTMKVCDKELNKTASVEERTEVVSNLISSIVSNTENKQTLDMSNDTTNNPDVGKNLSENSLQVQESKTPVVDPTIHKTNVPDVQDNNNKQVPESNQAEELKVLRQQVAEMQNEKKQEILNDMFSVVSDEKEREKTITEIAKANDLNTIKYIKTIVDSLAPLYKKQGESELSKQIKAKEEIQKQEQLKLSKNKVASYKFSLPGEPEEPAKEENPEANKIASKKIGEIAELQSLLKGLGGKA